MYEPVITCESKNLMTVMNSNKHKYDTTHMESLLALQKHVFKVFIELLLPGLLFSFWGGALPVV